ADLVAMARARVDAGEKNGARPAEMAARLETLARLEGDHSTGTPREHMEIAVRREPRAERWLAIAELCPESACEFAALSSAVNADAKSAAAQAAMAAFYAQRDQLERARDFYR